MAPVALGLAWLQAGDLFVIVRKRDRKRVAAVAQVQGIQLEKQSDQNLLLQHLQPERHEKLVATFPSASIL